MSRLTFKTATFIACSLVLFCQSLVAQDATTRSKARAVFEANNGKIYVVKALVDVEISANGTQAGNREVTVWTNGPVVSDGIVLIAYSGIKPRLPANIRQRGVEMKLTPVKVQLVNQSGEEFDGRLVLHDEDLDLAFIAFDRTADNAGDRKATPIDVAKDAEFQHLDTAVVMSRAGESQRFQPTVRLGEVNTIIPRPRRMYSCSGLTTSSAVFNLDGEFVGLSVRKTPATGAAFSAVLPSKYIRKLLPQAIEKAAEEATAEEATAEETGEEAEAGEGEVDSNKETDADKDPKSDDADQ